MSTPPELIYFDSTGRANMARLAFVVGGVDFIDTRISFAEWPAVKADTSSVPCQLFGSMPCLKHGDCIFAQSVAIASYAAELGIYKSLGENAAVVRAVDLMVAITNDEVKQAMYRCLFGDEESKSAGLKDLPEKAGKLLATLERALERKTCAGLYFMSSDGPTLADLAVFDNVYSPFPGLKALGVDLYPYPKLVACADAVGEIEEVKAFVANGWKL